MVTPPRSPANRSLLRRNVIVAASTAAGVALLLSYHTSLDAGAAATSVSTVAAPASAPASTTAAPEGSSSTDAGTSTGASSTGSTSTGSTTITGDSVDTRFGPVQVEITVQDGRIVAADAVVSPDGDHRSAEINAQAVPLLNEQAVAAQTAGIDGVSGATYTSRAYMESLQSAIDQAAATTAVTS